MHSVVIFIIRVMSKEPKIYTIEIRLPTITIMNQ
jgi:hypothetical protein